MKVMIIGGGAAGLMAGALLNENNISYDLYEKNKIFGSKILASGNGKCNISNINAGKNLDAEGNRKYFLENRKAITLFNNWGLYTTCDDEGRMYPISGSSKTVLELLLSKNNSKSLHLNVDVKNINTKCNKFIFNNITYDYLIVTIGSIANVINKKQDGYYDLIDNLGVKMTPLKPSLVGFKVKENIKALSGLRQKANVSLYNNQELIHREYGEVIFKEDGISGIVIMNMSYYYNHLKNLTNPYLKLELIPELSDKELSKMNKNLVLHPLLANYLNKDWYKIVKDFKLTINTTYDFNSAQVVSGGIMLSEIDKNYSYIGNKKIYFGGEILDFDAVCGGYNLDFAFNSAITIVEDIINEI